MILKNIFRTWKHSTHSTTKLCLDIKDYNNKCSGCGLIFPKIFNWQDNWQDRISETLNFQQSKIAYLNSHLKEKDFELKIGTLLEIKLIHFNWLSFVYKRTYKLIKVNSQQDMIYAMMLFSLLCFYTLFSNNCWVVYIVSFQTLELFKDLLHVTPKFRKKIKRTFIHTCIYVFTIV